MARLKWLAVSQLACLGLAVMARGQDKGVGVETVKAAEKLGAERYAVVIGINEYQDKAIPALHFAESDARAVYETLTDPQVGGIKPDNAVLLLGKDATTRKVLRAIDDLRTIPKDATVFIFFSGHGAKESGDAFWVTHDSELGGLSSTAVPDREIHLRTDRIPTHRLIMLLDCCYAAATVKEQKNVVDIAEALKSFVGKGRVTITASGNGDEAIEAKDLKHGVFAHYLLEALRGAADGSGGPADGIVTVPELTSYIDRTVADAARQRKGIQKPNIFMEEVEEPGKFLVTVDPKRIAELAAAALRETALVKSRLEALKKLAIEDRISVEQHQLGRRLLSGEALRLDEQDRQRLDYFLELVSGKLEAKHLQRLLDSVETPEQRAARLERERLAAQVTSTLGKLEKAYRKKNGEEAYRLFSELTKLSPNHPSLGDWRKRVEELGPAKELTLDLGGGVKMELVLIPAGEFMMGSPESEDSHQADESPVHRVKIALPFYLGKYEVTNEQYRRYKADHDSGDYEGVGLNGNDQPVVQVSWNDAKAFCDWMSNKTGKTARLPTEAEWEYAARGGDARVFPWGNRWPPSSGAGNYADATAKGKFSNSTAIEGYQDGYAGTAPVGSFAANPFRLYDMGGNVWEWCEDLCHEDYSGAPTNGGAWLSGGKLDARVLRGGSWNYSGRGDLRSAYRNRCGPDDRSTFVGFRVGASLGT